MLEDDTVPPAWGSGWPRGAPLAYARGTAPIQGETNMLTIKRSILLVLILTVSAATRVKAQAQVEIIPDVVYGHKDGLALTFDVLKPKANANGAAVIFM